MVKWALFRTMLSSRAGRAVLVGGTVLTGLAGVLLLMSNSVSDAQTARTPAKPASARPAAPAADRNAARKADDVTIVDSQPVTHARQASISVCLPAISELARLTLDAPNMALSTWNKSDANDHMFSSIAGLKYDNAIAPHAIAVIAAAPNPAHACDGEAVQVQPSSLACDAIQKKVGSGLSARDLNGVTLLQGDGPIRFALIPAAANGCTVVAIGSYYAN